MAKDISSGEYSVDDMMKDHTVVWAIEDGELKVSRNLLDLEARHADELIANFLEDEKKVRSQSGLPDLNKDLVMDIGIYQMVAGLIRTIDSSNMNLPVFLAIPNIVFRCIGSGLFDARRNVRGFGRVLELAAKKKMPALVYNRIDVSRNNLSDFVEMDSVYSVGLTLDIPEEGIYFKGTGETKTYVPMKRKLHFESIMPKRESLRNYKAPDYLAKTPEEFSIGCSSAYVDKLLEDCERVGISAKRGVIADTELVRHVSFL